MYREALSTRLQQGAFNGFLERRCTPAAKTESSSGKPLDQLLDEWTVKYKQQIKPHDSLGARIVVLLPEPSRRIKRLLSTPTPAEQQNYFPQELHNKGLNEGNSLHMHDLDEAQLVSA